MPNGVVGEHSLIGRTLGHYRVIEEIGAGGMGVVCRARDEHLARDVAIKVLTPGTVVSDSMRKHFRKEALILSQLNHPNIAIIHDFDTQQGVDFLVMEYIPGVTLSEKIAIGPVQENEVLRLGVQLADGLSAAHAHGVVHRDLKPGNLRVTSEGRLKILDFGLAELRLPVTPDAATVENMSQDEPTSGTLPYMAPEQLLAEASDARTDIHAAGLVLYEMASGRHPFADVDRSQLIGAILHKKPFSLRTGKRAPSAELERIIQKCLEKQPENRYQSAKELEIDLRRLSAPTGCIQEVVETAASTSERRAAAGGSALFKPATLVVVALALLALAVLGYLAWSSLHQSRKNRWAREVALPNAQALIANDDWAAAYATAVEAERYIPTDPQLKEVFSDVSILFSVKTEPPGADVFLKPYASTSDRWEFVGRTPIASRRIPRGFQEYKISKHGYDLVTGFTGADQRLPAEQGVQINLERTLAPAGSTPDDMVRVDGGKYKPSLLAFNMLPEVDLEPFLIDRYETSNSQYQAFVDAGGYRGPKYWKHAFVVDEKQLSWKQAMARFTDKTGRNGPTNWELGHFPEGQDNYPVSGISWYEAAAYAEFSGNSLPTIYHWNRAAGINDVSGPSRASSSMIAPVIRTSNFAGSAPAPLGKFRGISPYGAFDMAGNVREWVWNGTEGRRYILGGAWGTPDYLFWEDGELLSPWDRSVTNGLRCMRPLGTQALPAATLIEVQPKPRKPSIPVKPVSDDVFKVYASYYSYDKRPLNASAEPFNYSSPHYVRQRVTFNAAYPGEKVIAYLFLPKTASPPFQTVIMFPGAGARVLHSIDDYASANYISMFTRSGRAVVWPIYKGTFERPRVELSSPLLRRDYDVMLYKDLARTLDYLETRPELDHSKFAYFGLSWGACLAPIFGALEKRLTLFVLEAGGLAGERLPEDAPANFAPHHTAPTYMFNGRYDLLFPVETSAEPFIDLLGTPKQNKALILYDGGHAPPLDSKLKKDMLDYLDRYFGPVR